MRKLLIFAILPWSMQIYQEKQKGFEGSSEYRIMKGFLDKGHEVRLLIPKEEKTKERHVSYYGIDIHKFRTVRILERYRLVLKLVRRARLSGLLAEIELRLSKRAEIPKDGYLDHLLIFQKSDVGDK
jgi:hypothetical protein